MRPLAVRAARLFDGHDSIANATVLIDDGRISAVERGVVQFPADIEVLDFGDATIMPGLIDTHVHLGFDASSDPVTHLAEIDDVALVLQMRRAAIRQLLAGVTTVRDLGDRNFLALRLRDSLRHSGEVGPEIIAAGPPITTTGGHCHFLNGCANTDEELRQGVQARAERGVDAIKVMAGGGQLTPGVGPLGVQYPATRLRVVVDEAHRHGLPVTAHAHGATVVAAAVDAGVDGLEHAGFWVPDGVHADQSEIDRIAEAQIFVCPTLGLMPDAEAPPAAVATRWAAKQKVVARMHQAGVRLLAGSDAGVGPPKPHGVLPYSVAALGAAGLANAEALAGATSLAASACGVGDRKGRLAPGFDADVLVVDGDPMLDLDALRRIRAVFRGGVLVAPLVSSFVVTGR